MGQTSWNVAQYPDSLLHFRKTTDNLKHTVKTLLPILSKHYPTVRHSFNCVHNEPVWVNRWGLDFLKQGRLRPLTVAAIHWVCCHHSAAKVLCLNPSCSSLATLLLLLCVLALWPYFTAGWINSVLDLVVLSAIAASQICFKSCSSQIKPTHFCRHFIISAWSEIGEAFSYVPQWPNIRGRLPKTRDFSLICEIWRSSNPPVNKPVTQRKCSVLSAQNNEGSRTLKWKLFLSNKITKRIITRCSFIDTVWNIN